MKVSDVQTFFKIPTHIWWVVCRTFTNQAAEQIHTQVSNATKLNSVFEDTCRVACFGDCEHRADEHFRQWIKENNAEAQEKYLTVCYTQCAAICQQRLDPFRTTVGNCMAPSWCSENAFLVIFYVDSNQNGTATNSVISSFLIIDWRGWLSFVYVVASLQSFCWRVTSVSIQCHQNECSVLTRARLFGAA